MKLDEAIEHAEEKACGNSACEREHRQLAEWLKELKQYKEGPATIMGKVIFPPKECFGNYLDDGCKNHHTCEMRGECNVYTNYFKGACDCPFKKSCHTPRQELQATIRKEQGDPDIRKCDFYNLFIRG
jgi:hypothetical protein